LLRTRTVSRDVSSRGIWGKTADNSIFGVFNGIKPALVYCHGISLAATVPVLALFHGTQGQKKKNVATKRNDIVGK
jgi:hypothetical protein